MATSSEIQQAKTIAGSTITRVETDPATGARTFVSLGGVKVPESSIRTGSGPKRGAHIVQGVGGKWVNGVWEPNDPTGGTVIVSDPQAKKSAVVQATPENLEIIEAGRQKTIALRASRRPLTSAQTAVALEVSQQKVKFSPKAGAVRASRLAEAKQSIAEPTKTEVFLAGGRIKATGTAQPFSPDKTPSPRVDSTQKGRSKDDNRAFVDASVSLSPELASEVRARQEFKPIQQTSPSFIGAEALSKVKGIDQSPPTLKQEPKHRPKILISSQTDVVRFLQDKPTPGKIIHPFNPVAGIAHDFFISEGSGEFTRDFGLALASDNQFRGAGLVGGALVFTGSASKTAFDVTLGIPKTLVLEGPGALLESYNPVNVADAIRQDKLLKSTTPGLRVAELGGMVAGLSVGTKLTNRAYRKLRTSRFESHLKNVNARNAIDTKGSLRLDSKGQAKFERITESGAKQPSFETGRVPEVHRTTISTKTLTQKFKGGKQIQHRKTSIKQFDPVKDPLKKLVADPLAEAGKAPGQTHITKKLQPTKPGKLQDITPADKGRSRQAKLESSDLKPGEFDINRLEHLDLSPRTATAPSLIYATFNKKFPFFGVITETIKAPKLKGFSPPPTEGPLIHSPRPSFLLPPKIIFKENEIIKTFPDLNTGTFEGSRIMSQPDSDKIIPPSFKLELVQEPRSITERISQNVPRSIQETGPGADQGPGSRSETIPEQDIILIPKIDISSTSRSTTAGPGEFRLPREPPVEKKPPKLPRFKPDREIIAGPAVPVYDVYAREKRAFIKVNKKPLPEKRAKNLGAEVVDNTASATFRIKRVGRAKRTDALAFNLKNKFVQRDGVFIEKPSRRIDTRGELLGITVKGWMANRTRGI